MTAELARSRGLAVVYSSYLSVVINDGREVPIDEGYDRILRRRDGQPPRFHWRSDIPGKELADILEAGLVELEGEVVEP